MPNIASARKKLRADLRKRKVNIRVKEQVKSTSKEFTEKASAENLGKVYSALDTAAKKNVISKKKVARKKSQFSNLIKSVSKKQAVSGKKSPKRGLLK
jgi:ribosomal protein S20